MIPVVSLMSKYLLRVNKKALKHHHWTFLLIISRYFSPEHTNFYKQNQAKNKKSNKKCYTDLHLGFCNPFQLSNSIYREINCPIGSVNQANVFYLKSHNRLTEAQMFLIAALRKFLLLPLTSPNIRLIILFGFTCISSVFPSTSITILNWNHYLHGAQEYNAFYLYTKIEKYLCNYRKTCKKGWEFIGSFMTEIPII